ncbi:MAG: hypothetical protein IRY97_11695, partial [Thermomicrobiaceae bacterium]|nr:hypothetical protein [Thermomicrobiaceae bacterium]
MTVKAVVKRNTYYDSVTLMTASRVVNQLPGVEVAAITMGTALNRELLQDSGLATAETEGAGPNDLIVAVRAASEEIADMALAAAEAELAPKAGAVEVGLARPRPRTLTAALRVRPETNLALISVPGAFAAVEAEEALRAGLHVFLFSDNVPIEAEVRLKRLAAERGLLLMGPDCGTAIVNGVGVGFANVVR